MLLPSLVLALGSASDLTGAWELWQAGSALQGPRGIYQRATRRPHPRLWASGLSRVFFVFFTEPLTSCLAPVESSSLFPSAPRAGSDGLEVAEQAKSRALGEFWSQRTNHFSFDIEVTGECPRPLATLSFLAPFHTLVGKTGLALTLGCPSSFPSPKEGAVPRAHSRAFWSSLLAPSMGLGGERRKAPWEGMGWKRSVGGQAGLHPS